MVTCPNCGAENPEHAKFCLECGQALGSARSSAGSRRVVTILFADVVGSTGLGERLDPETLRALLARYFVQARQILERHGGTVEKYIGDAIMAIFGIPALHEDDALRAVRAAAELQASFSRINIELEAERGFHIDFRIGVNSGEVVSSAAEGSLITGDAVNVAARLEQSAAAGEVLIGRPTLDLVRDDVVVDSLPSIEAKGKSGSVDAYRLLKVADVPRTLRVAKTPFVGRARELRRLEEAFEDAQTERRCYLFTLLGSAGVGKSRLVAESTRIARDGATVLTGRCLPYGEGVTFWPIAEIVREQAGVDEGAAVDDARARLARTAVDDAESERVVQLMESALGMSAEAAAQGDLFWAIRRWLEGQARHQPLVCVIEDIHWAEPTLLDLLEHVADWTRDAPMLLLCTARPELLEARPNWGGGRVNATTILLERLTGEATRELVVALVAQAGLPDGIVGRVLETAEGNPLFAEEIVRMLGDDRRDHRIGSAESLSMPTTVQAVIAARLDRLPAGERIVAERASIAGRVFERGAVVALLPETEPAAVAEQLMGLMRKELVQPDHAELTVGDAFRFRHILIRDAAYETLAKQERAQLHQRFAKWIEDVTGERATEYAEIIGYHYEQAHRYRRELGHDDEGSEQLGRRAGELLSGAARRAHLHGDHAAAAKLYRRAVAVMHPSEERCAALFGLMLSIQDMQLYEGKQLIADLQREATDLGLSAWVWKAQIMSLINEAWSNPAYNVASADVTIQRALNELMQLGDDQGIALALYQLGDGHLARAEWAKATATYQRGLAYASRSDALLEDRLLGRIGNAALWGSTPSAEVIAMFEEHMRRHSAVKASGVMAGLALAYAFAGKRGEAWAALDQALKREAEIVGEDDAETFPAGYVGYVLGDLDAAQRHLRQSIAVRERQGETGARSTLVGLLGVVVIEADGPLDEARRLAEECRALTSVDDAASQALWRVVLALVAGRSGDADEAERLLAEAQGVAATTDFLHLQGLVARSAAAVAEWRGDLSLAVQRQREALRYFEQKDDVPDAQRAREAIARLAI